jgi:hypothetical protein
MADPMGALPEAMERYIHDAYANPPGDHGWFGPSEGDRRLAALNAMWDLLETCASKDVREGLFGDLVRSLRYVPRPLGTGGAATASDAIVVDPTLFERFQFENGLHYPASPEYS